MTSKRTGRVTFALLILVGILSVESAGAGEIPGPGPRDTCPVCGMFVARYPEWIATLVYTDGQAEHFDGAKDMFKYLREMARWASGRDPSEILALRVTEYYSLERIGARHAWYVIGSDVLGPMGHELIPLESREAADEFIRDHFGVRILRFDEVDSVLLRGLDEGRFE